MICSDDRSRLCQRLLGLTRRKNSLRVQERMSRYDQWRQRVGDEREHNGMSRLDAG
jgi:hypothetical protein